MFGKPHIVIIGRLNIVNITEFQAKDVINVIDGSKLGSIGDFEINVQTGQIDAIIIYGNHKVFQFFNRDEELVIPWKNILKIGQDVILVKWKTDVNLQIEGS
jgi:YlmC/YmxH family sporulation protein